MSDKKVTMADVRDELSKEIERGKIQTSYLTIDFELVVAARDRIDAQDTKIAKLEEKLAELRPLADDVLGPSLIQDYEDVGGVVRKVADRVKTPW